jgi:methylmalonyl-CoA mutase
VDKILNEFPPISVEDWEKIISKDLKGQDYTKKLVWKTSEGFSLNPYYTEETSRGKNLPKPPGMPSTWAILEEISDPKIQTALEHANLSIEGGSQGWKVTSLWNGNQVDGICLETEESIATFANNLIKKLPNASLYWETGSSTLRYQKALSQSKKELKQSNNSSSIIQGGFFQDPLAALTICGKFPNNKQSTFENLKKSILYGEENLQDYHSFVVSGNLFSNLGATLSQELAYTLAMGSEYMNQMLELGISAEITARQIFFRFSVGSNYFHEIAKLRAFRFLWAKVLEAYKVPTEQRSTHIYAETSTWNTTAFDPYVNMIRVTTEAMSAVLGGADALLVHPFDSVISQNGTDFSQRIARNVSLLLRHESYLDKVVDPSNGSYYIDHLTFNFSETAWILFQEVEKEDGYLQSLKDGKIQARIQNSVEAKMTNILSKKEPILGTSLFPNLSETIQPSVKRQLTKVNKSPFTEFTGESDIKVKLIPAWRSSEIFEALRMSIESIVANGNVKPKVFLLIYGNPSMRTARASFATNFFGVAGFEISNPGAQEMPADAVQKAILSEADLIVFCSSDEEYEPIVKEFGKKILSQLPKTKLVIAGNPTESMDSLRSLGVYDFISVKTNLYESLKSYVALFVKP